MQKALDYLEKYVQWVALGLGAIYLLYILWAYVVTPPVSTTLKTRDGMQTVTLADIDQLTVEGPAKQLQRAMDNTTPVQIHVTRFDEQFAAAMKWTGIDFPQFATGNWISSPTAPIELQEIAHNQQTTAPTVAATVPTGIPAPVAAAIEAGRSRIQPPANIAAAPNVPPGNPVQPVANQSVDKLWATASFKIPMAPIAKAFADAKVPPAQMQTLFLSVEVVREESMDGGWGNSTVITPLPLVQMMPFPKADDRGGEVVYQDWASKNQDLILQPPFYQTLGGDPWHVPGSVIPVVANPNQPNPGAFDPSRVRPADVAKLTPDQKQQYFARKQQEQQKEAEKRRQEILQRRQQNQPRRNTAPPDLRRNGPPPGYAPVDPRFGPIAQVDPRGRQQLPPGYPPYPGQVPYPGMDDNMRMDMPGRPPMAGPNAQQLDAANKAAAGIIPTGPFDPNQMGDVLAWIHDDTVQPNHTYRYKLRYRILNPLYRSINIAKDPKDARVFSIQSPWSDWSSQVSIPSTTIFFADGGIFNNTARFLVYKWEGGVWRAKTFQVAPGDIIGAKTDDVDYSTGWTLVDMSDSTAQNQFTLVTDGSGLQRRDPRQERQDPMYTKLKELTEGAKPLPPPGGPMSSTR